MMLTMLRLSTDLASLKTDGSEIPQLEAAKSSCRLATGRCALSHLISRLPKKTSQALTVLMPCYVAEGVIKPFLADDDCNVLFYPLNSDLTPQSDDVDRILQDVSTPVVMVLIHYFGFSAWSDRLKDVLHKHDCLVVEDCAHALLSTTPPGQSLAGHADVALYSLNKILPVADGALLVSCRSDIDVALEQDGLPELPREAQEAYRRHLDSCRALYECEEPKKAKGILEDVGRHYEDYYDVINNDLSPYRQSDASKQLEEQYPFGWCGERRRENATHLLEHLNSRVVEPVHTNLPSGIVPFGIPARVPATRRSEIVDRLFEHGVLLSTLEDKWDFVPHDRQDEFSFEAAFLKDHVLIPVSEFIPMDAVKTMTHEINRL